MANTRTNTRDKGLGAGGIAALIVAGLVLIGILAGVVLYAHSGRTAVDPSAGILAANETTEVTQDPVAAAHGITEAAEAGAASAEGGGDSSKVKSAAGAAQAAYEGKGGGSSSGITFKSNVSAKTLGKYYEADTDAFRAAYDGKVVTVAGTISAKSAKMLYVEFDTGVKVPLRVYLSTEDQREQFNKFSIGDSISVKGTVGVVYPLETDAGGFQEMADGLIALDAVSLVK